VCVIMDGGWGLGLGLGLGLVIRAGPAQPLSDRELARWFACTCAANGKPGIGWPEGKAERGISGEAVVVGY
jgi:hypothetical protein